MGGKLEIRNNFLLNTLKIKIMETTKIQLFVILLLVVFSISCNKDDDPAPIPVVYEEENPLAGYLATSGFDQATISLISDANSESGFSFRPTVKGKINALVLKGRGIEMIRVTIWDKMTEAILRTETINLNATNTEIVKVITPLELVINKEYVITMNARGYYNRMRIDRAATSYPIVSGNISVTGCRYINDGINQTFPANAYTTQYKGDCSFKFQRTE